MREVKGMDDRLLAVVRVEECLREEFKAQDSQALYYHERRFWTPEMWRKWLPTQHKFSNVRTISKSISNSLAWFKLSLPAREVIRAACTEVKWDLSPVKITNKNKRRNPWGAHDPTKFALPYARIQAMCVGPNAKGLNSPTSVHKAIQECVDAGFLDRVGKPRKGKLSWFTLSTRFMDNTT